MTPEVIGRCWAEVWPDSTRILRGLPAFRLQIDYRGQGMGGDLWKWGQHVHTCICTHKYTYVWLPRWLNGKEECRRLRRYGFHPWFGKIPWRRAWQPSPLFICNLLLFLNIILRFIHVAGVAVIHSCFTVPKLGYPFFYICIFNLSSVFVVNNLLYTGAGISQLQVYS